MKVYKKNELSFVNGMLVHEATGDVVAIDNEIIDIANELDLRVQKSRWLETKPKACVGPDYSEFERESMFNIGVFHVDTPLIDKKTMEALDFMDEIDKALEAEQLNKVIENFFKQLILFAKDDTVISIDGQSSLHKFDTPVIGNPLTWTEEGIINLIAEYHGYKSIDIDEAVSENIDQTVEDTNRISSNQLSENDKDCIDDAVSNSKINEQ